jgi:hypothetical protein
MRHRTSSLFVHQFYQTPAVASVWIDATDCDRHTGKTKAEHLFRLFFSPPIL